MKHGTLIFIFLFNFIFSQVNQYMEPLSFIHDGNFIIKDLHDSNIITFNEDSEITQYNLNDIENDFNYINLHLDYLHSGIMFFIINPSNKSFIGPYDHLNINNNIIKTDPIKGTGLILEINNLDHIDSSFEILVEVKSFDSDLRINQERLSPIRSRDEPIIMVTGYWPPTNEMIRHFSQSEQLNPGGWQGEDWENRGYDIIAYFPTFFDPDCSNCGQGSGVFEVDYQDTSEDFWPIAEDHSPIALITFSRGYINYSWELENNFYNRTNWINDYSSPFLPTPNPPDENEDSYFLRNSNLPMNTIVENIDNLNLDLDPYIDTNGDPGHFVSEFMGYHGVWYRDLYLNGEDQCYAAGHVHVGGQVDWGTARLATEETIRTLINYLDEFTYTPGDVNQDDVIDILDLIIVMNHILGSSELSTLEFYASDMNEDANINIQDIIIIINIILDNL